MAIWHPSSPHLGLACHRLKVSTALQIAKLSGHSAMLAAVLSLPTKQTWVNRETDARMKELHPSTFDDRGKLRKLVAEGLNKGGVTDKRLLDRSGVP